MLPVVGERGRRRRRIAAYRAHRGQDGDVTVAGAAGAAQVGEAEPAEGGVAVGVAAARGGPSRRGVGAPLDHPERQVGSGELADRARIHRPGARTVERVDQPGRVGDHAGGGRRGRGDRGGRRDEDARHAHQGHQGGHGSGPVRRPQTGSLHPTDGTGDPGRLPSRHPQTRGPSAGSAGRSDSPTASASGGFPRASLALILMALTELVAPVCRTTATASRMMAR